MKVTRGTIPSDKLKNIHASEVFYVVEKGGDLYMKLVQNLDNGHAKECRVVRLEDAVICYFSETTQVVQVQGEFVCH